MVELAHDILIVHYSRDDVLVGEHQVGRDQKAGSAAAGNVDPADLSLEGGKALVEDGRGDEPRVRMDQRLEWGAGRVVHPWAGDREAEVLGDGRDGGVLGPPLASCRHQVGQPIVHPGLLDQLMEPTFERPADSGRGDLREGEFRREVVRRQQFHGLLVEGLIQRFPEVHHPRAGGLPMIRHAFILPRGRSIGPSEW